MIKIENIINKEIITLTNNNQYIEIFRRGRVTIGKECIIDRSAEFGTKKRKDNWFVKEIVGYPCLKLLFSTRTIISKILKRRINSGYIEKKIFHDI